MWFVYVMLYCIIGGIVAFCWVYYNRTKWDEYYGEKTGSYFDAVDRYEAQCWATVGISVFWPVAAPFAFLILSAKVLTSKDRNT